MIEIDANLISLFKPDLFPFLTQFKQVFKNLLILFHYKDFTNEKKTRALDSIIETIQKQAIQEYIEDNNLQNQYCLQKLDKDLIKPIRFLQESI